MSRILIVSNLYPSKKDPTYGTFVYNFCKELESYFENTIIDKCVIRGRTTSIIIRISKYIIFYLSSFFHLLCFKYDLVYVHYISHSIPPVWLALKFRKQPIAYNVHGDDLIVRSKQGELFLKMAQSLLCKSKIIVVPSSFFKELLLIKNPAIIDNNIIVSPSGGVDKSFYYPENIEKKSCSVIHLGYVSRIDKGKGWSLFIRSVKQLTERGTNVKASIVGMGNQTEEMNNLIGELNLNSVITYYGGVSHAELPSLYRSLDLFVFPTSLQESLGLVGLEAMAACTPVVGSNIGGLKSFIIDGVNGFLFEPDDIEDLNSKILRYLELDRDKKNQMRLSAYKTALEYESKMISTRLFKQMNDIYKIDSFNNK